MKLASYRFFLIAVGSILIGKSLSQETTTAFRCPFGGDGKPSAPCPPIPKYENYPTYPTYSTYPPEATTTSWSIAYSTYPGRNSTTGSNYHVTWEPYDLNGYRLVKQKMCRNDEYLSLFRYITEPEVCADRCKRESSCAGFTVSIYSGACEAFTFCNEEADEDWVIYYRQAARSTTRIWAGTTPAPEFFIDLGNTSNVTSLLSKVESHYSPYQYVLDKAFAAPSTGLENDTSYPLTRLSTPQSVIISRTLYMAWKARLMFDFPAVDGWYTDGPPQFDSQMNPINNGSSDGSNGKRNICNQGTVDSACKLLRLNNEGRLFLLPWSWESFFNKNLPASPTPGLVSPLFTVMSLCYGEAPPTYTHELVCPDPAMLNAIGALSRAVFNTYSQPLYVGAIIGTPSYVNEDGLPSVTHYYGSGVDFLCGVAIYASAERGYDETCHFMVRQLRRPPYGLATPCDDVILPGQSENVGCGASWWPVPVVHCDKTIIGSKKRK